MQDDYTSATSFPHGQVDDTTLSSESAVTRGPCRKRFGSVNRSEGQQHSYSYRHSLSEVSGRYGEEWGEELRNCRE